MGRGQYETDRSQDEVHELFNRIIGGRGQSITAFERVLAMPYNGSTFGGQRAQLRSPDSNFYAKPYVEALATARTLAKLGLDSDVEDIQNSDRPDVIVTWRDGTQTYVEHTIADSIENLSYPRHLEQASIAFRRGATSDAVLKAALQGGTLTVKLRDPGMQSRAKPAQLAGELAALRDLWLPGVFPLRVDPTRAPVLHAYNAQVFYRLGRVPTGALIFQQQGGLIVGSNSTPYVLRALEKKRRVAQRYDRANRPLWLIVSVAEHPTIDITGADRRAVAAAVMASPAIDPFDRVVIEVSSHAPIVRDAS